MKNLSLFLFLGALLATLPSCKQSESSVSNIEGDAAEKVYVAPGEHDELYAFLSGGYNGQMSVYGIPSGRLLKVIPVFSQHPENGYGYSEESKAMLNSTFGFVPWDDLHHPKLSRTDGMADGRWLLAAAARLRRAPDCSRFRGNDGGAGTTR